MTDLDVEILFHGSNSIVENPVVQVSGFYKDFGYGFFVHGLNHKQFVGL